MEAPMSFFDTVASVSLFFQGRHTAPLCHAVRIPASTERFRKSLERHML
jgi:hypothetical protein